MPLHQLTDPFLGSIVEPQPVHDAVGNAAGNHAVSHEMSDALRVQGEALRLTHIVKQHRPAEHRVRRRGVQSMKRVLPYVITVVRIPLVKSHHRQNFRQHRADHVRVPPQDGRCPRAAEQLRQFLVNTLRGHLPQQVPTGQQCLAGFRFDGKAQHRRKPQAAQDSQGVL